RKELECRDRECRGADRDQAPGAKRKVITRGKRRQQDQTDRGYVAVDEVREQRKCDEGACQHRATAFPECSPASGNREQEEVGRDRLREKAAPRPGETSVF